MNEKNSSTHIRLLFVEDDHYLRTSLASFLEPEGFTITQAETLGAAGECLLKQEFDLVLMDLSLPDGNGMDLLRSFSTTYQNRMVVLTGTGTIGQAVEAMKEGVFDFLEKPVNPGRLLSCLQKAWELNRTFKEYATLKKEVSSAATFDKLIHSSPAMTALVQKAKKIALTESTVLITGETGTGKDILASSLHHASRRCNQAFIGINCASIPENLAESELFGYCRGAFTGAEADYPGKFQLADGGTIFLDEIAELPLILQGKLLRTLDSGEISPLKSTRHRKVNVRVIAATNKNLEEQIQLNRFREDLFYRIDELKLHVPPLRERQEDILPLAAYFLSIANIANSKRVTGFHPKVETSLINYPWPGNVRELKNCINEMAALISGSLIKPEHLPAKLLNRQPAGITKDGEFELKVLEKNHIIRVLKMTGFDYHKTYGLLGISRATLYRKLQEYDIRQHH
jgi:two-component system, NtrC family, response regulator